MKTRLGCSFEIDFAHTLRGHPKCGKPHGHTSRIIVEVQGDVKKGGSYEENMVIEFDKMKKLCWETIEQLDHRNLNELFDFPTSENITEWIFDNLKDKVPLHSVKFFEGTNKYCEITSDQNYLIKISVETISVNGIAPLIEFHTNLSIEYFPVSWTVQETDMPSS